MNKVQAHITHCLDQVAMQSPSTITWDIFAWPESNRSYWKEDCHPCSPGSTVDLSSRMPGIRLVLHDEGGKYQGVARVLKYEGHMLVYDPQTNGAGWVTMRDVPSSLTEVELQSASDLGNFYPIPCTMSAGPKATQPPPEETTVEYKQTETQTREPMAGDFDKYIKWDTDDVQDRSHTLSPMAIINEPSQGKSVKETPPARQNICLVSERVMEPRVVPPREHMPVTEKNTPQDDDASR